MIVCLDEPMGPGFFLLFPAEIEVTPGGGGTTSSAASTEDDEPDIHDDDMEIIEMAVLFVATKDK